MLGNRAQRWFKRAYAAPAVLTALLLALSAAAAQEPTAAQRRHIERLLADPGDNWAITRRMNGVIDQAIVCRDLATVDAIIDGQTRSRMDRLASQATRGRSELLRQAASEPNVAALGCVEIPAGTKVRVEVSGAAPLISTPAIHGVTNPAMIELQQR